MPEHGAPGEWAIHATALLLREIGVLIRGASGAGKSRLATILLDESGRAADAVRLIGDDRIWLREVNGRVLARGDPRIAGLIERRGEGLAQILFEPAVVLGCVVDLLEQDTTCDIPPRLPDAADKWASFGGLSLPRLALPRSISGSDAAGRVRAFVHRLEGPI